MGKGELLPQAIVIMTSQLGRELIARFPNIQTRCSQTNIRIKMANDLQFWAQEKQQISDLDAAWMQRKAWYATKHMDDIFIWPHEHVILDFETFIMNTHLSPYRAPTQ